MKKIYAFYTKAIEIYTPLLDRLSKNLCSINEQEKDFLLHYIGLYENVVRRLSVQPCQFPQEDKKEMEEEEIERQKIEGNFFSKKDVFSRHEIRLMELWQTITKIEQPNESFKLLSKKIKNAIGINDCINFRQDLESIIIKEIVKAKKEIHVRVNCLSNKEIIDALIEQGEKGLKIQIIISNSIDFGENCKPGVRGDTEREQVERLLGFPNVTVFHFKSSNKYSKKMHIKEIIIDRKRKISGSFNFSAAASKSNKEVINIVSPRKKSILIEQNLIDFDRIKQYCTQISKEILCDKLGNNKDGVIIPSMLGAKFSKAKPVATSSKIKVKFDKIKTTFDRIKTKVESGLVRCEKPSRDPTNYKVIHQQRQQQAILAQYLQKLDRLKLSLAEVFFLKKEFFSTIKTLKKDLFPKIKTLKRQIKAATGINRMIIFENKGAFMKKCILQEIDQAQTSLYITMYELEDEDIIDKLTKKANDQHFQELKIVLCDRALQGTTKRKDNIISYYNLLSKLIESPKVIIHTYRANSCMHVKQTIIDKSRVLEGSINFKNIGKNYEMLDITYPAGIKNCISGNLNLFESMVKDDDKVGRIKKIDNSYLDNLILTQSLPEDNQKNKEEKKARKEENKARKEEAKKSRKEEENNIGGNKEKCIANREKQKQYQSMENKTFSSDKEISNQLRQEIEGFNGELLKAMGTRGKAKLEVFTCGKDHYVTLPNKLMSKNKYSDKKLKELLDFLKKKLLHNYPDLYL